VHLAYEKLQALDLHVGAGKAVEDGAVVILLADQAAKEEADDFAVTDHVATVLSAFGLGSVEKSTDDDGRTGEAARARDEIGVGAFAGAGGATEQDNFLGKTEVLAADLFLKALPDRTEDELRVLDLKVRELGRRRGGTLMGVG